MTDLSALARKIGPFTVESTTVKSFGPPKDCAAVTLTIYPDRAKTIDVINFLQALVEISAETKEAASG